MIELTQEQSRALAQSEGSSLTLVDPTSRTIYALVAADLETQLQQGLHAPALGQTSEQKETPVAPWKYLVARKHPWRRQLCIKGRNMTVRQLLSNIVPNQFTDEQAATDMDLPIEAIREARAYAEQNAELLALETAYERYRLAQREKLRGPQSLPG